MATRIAYWNGTISSYLPVSDSSTGRTALAQRFTTGADYNIVSVILWMKRLNTATTLTVAIYDRDNGNPSSSLGSKVVDVSGWSETAEAKTIEFSSPISTTTGNYAIVLTEGSNWSTGLGAPTTGTGSGALKLVSGTWYDTTSPDSTFWFEVYGTSGSSSYVELTGTIAGTSTLSGVLTEGTRLNPPGVTYWYVSGGTGFYYRLIVQSDGSYGSHPPTGVENTDYTKLAGYEPNFINTNRRLIAAARNSVWYESI